MIDYHTHSRFSDGKNTYLELLHEAKNKGVTELGFSDHLCLNFPDWAIKQKDFNNVIKEITDIKETNDLPVKVKFGLEVDYLEGKEQEIKHAIELFPVDYVIGSVHYIDGWNFDTNIKDYNKVDINQFYNDYFIALNKAAKSGLFDIIGHADLAKKFNFYPEFDLNKHYENLAKAFKDADVVIELNTSGKDKMCKEFYPSDQFLSSCFQQNVPITLGSDTHKVSHIARYYDEAIEKLKSIGYRKVATFTNRKRSYLTL